MAKKKRLSNTRRSFARQAELDPSLDPKKKGLCPGKRVTVSEPGHVHKGKHGEIRRIDWGLQMNPQLVVALEKSGIQVCLPPSSVSLRG